LFLLQSYNSQLPGGVKKKFRKSVMIYENTKFLRQAAKKLRAICVTAKTGTLSAAKI